VWPSARVDLVVDVDERLYVVVAGGQAVERRG
jgi:hypothetical protein